MRRQIRSIPYELPHARISVDDLEAIEQILSQAMEKVAASRAEKDAEFEAQQDAFRKALNVPSLTSEGRQLRIAKSEGAENSFTAQKVTVTYVVGNTEMDSTDDLLEQGGSVTELAMHVGSPETYVPVSIEFRGRVQPPRISLTVLSQDDQWAVYGRVHEVLQNRRLVMKNFVDDLPEGVKLGAWFFVMFTPLILIILPFWSAIHKTQLGVVWNVALYGYCALASLCIFGSLFSYQATRIYFTRSHERLRASSDTIKKYAIGAITFVLGVIATKLIDRLFK